MGLVDCGNRLGWWISSVEAPSKPKANRSRLLPVIASTCSRFVPHPSQILSSFLTLNLLKTVWMWFSANQFHFRELTLKVLIFLCCKSGFGPAGLRHLMCLTCVLCLSQSGVSFCQPSLIVHLSCLTCHSIWSQWTN